MFQTKGTERAEKYGRWVARLRHSKKGSVAAAEWMVTRPQIMSDLRS